jgi:hypothetical protein
MSPTQYRDKTGPAPIPGCYVLMWRAGLPAKTSLPEKPRPSSPA